MATVVTPQFIPRQQNAGRGKLLQMLLASQQREEDEEKERQAGIQERAAGQVAAQELNRLFEGVEQGTGVDPNASLEFTRQMLASGGSSQQALGTISELNKRSQEVQEEARQQAALAQLGADLAKKGGQKNEFIGDVLGDLDLDTGIKIAILNQTKALFPEPKDQDFKDVTLFTQDGKERKIRVPESVRDPQAFIEREMPALIRAGFSTTKPAAAGARPTETERDVSSIVNTNPVLQRRLKAKEISPKEARNLARIAFRDRDKAITQLERDFSRVSEEGFQIFDSPRDRVIFELSRENITSVYASGITDLGEAVSKAKTLANQQMENLEFLPEELRLTPKRAGDLGHLARVTEFLLQDEEDFLGKEFITPDDRFSEIVRLFKNRLGGWTDEHTEALRRIVFGEPAVEEEEEVGLLDRIFSR